MIRVAAALFRIGLLNELAYRGNLGIQLINTAVGLAFTLANLSIVTTHTESLAGWSPPELLALMGVSTLVWALIQIVIHPSLGKFVSDVRMGTLDYVLTKPVEAQALISLRQLAVWRGADVLTGVGLIWAGAGQSALLGPHLPLFLAMLLSGLAIVYAFMLALASVAFWFVRVENILGVFTSVYEAGSWPIQVYPGWLRLFLTAVVPIAFAVTVPAEALLGRIEPATVALALALAIALNLAARGIWLFGLRRYSGASA